MPKRRPESFLGYLALGVKNRVIVHLRHTVELLFLHIGNCPDTEVKDRKEVGQDDWDERGKYLSLK